MKHVLCCRLDNMGDVLLTGPAVRAAAASADRVTFLAGPTGERAASLLPGVEAVAHHPAGWIDGSTVDRESFSALVDDISRRAITHALIFTSFHQSPLPLALALRLAGVGTIAAVCDDFPGSLLDVRHRVSPDVHEVERNLSLAATLGFRLPPGDDGRLHVDVDLPAPEPHLVAVHPGSTTPARTWALESFAESAALLAEAGWEVVVTGTSSERVRTRLVASAHPGIVDLGGRTDLPGLAEVMAAARVVVSGNTGPAHLAAAAGTPVVSIFPATVPHHRWRPWGVPTVVLGDQAVPCAGCRAFECPVPGQPCVGGVTAADVVAAVQRLVADRDATLPPISVPEVPAP